MNLKFTAIGAPGSVSPLTWERLLFNEGEPGTQSAASLGAGLRWTIVRRFSMAIDAAQVIDGTTTSKRGDRRVHVSLVYQF